jgi:hypothetical protein
MSYTHQAELALRLDANQSIMRKLSKSNMTVRRISLSAIVARTRMFTYAANAEEFGLGFGGEGLAFHSGGVHGSSDCHRSRPGLQSGRSCGVPYQGKHPELLSVSGNLTQSVPLGLRSFG